MMKQSVDEVLPELKSVLQTHTNAVLSAPPGAGKTTKVPLALLEEGWLGGRRILLLEPRRVAARAAARYMAQLLGEQVGKTVGYRVRMDKKVGPTTRIEVITEGVLTRMLQADQALEDVGLVIFDEFHERSLDADLGLALCLESQAVLREDLRILVMSATLDTAAAAALLGDAPVVASQGRSFPVETRYLDRPVSGSVEAAVVRTIHDALQNTQGDILVFLPGAGEIRKVQARLKEALHDGLVHIAPLYGNLSSEAQDQALRPDPAGHRKMVLATSIAETSLTVEGVSTVIDSGLMRVPRFSPKTGMTRLETVKVSRSSADQRRGRAGRLGPGVCYRLWTEQEDSYLPPFSTPEILEADLAPLALELAAWGVSDPAQLRWLDPPPAAAFAQARELLVQLGALREDGIILAHGRAMADLTVHPRLAHMILTAVPLGYGALACDTAAVLNERDFIRQIQGVPDADLRLRLEVLHAIQTNGRQPGFLQEDQTVDSATCRRILAEADRWKRRLNLAPHEGGDIQACGLLLAFAYPDRIGRKRSPGRFLLRNGRGAAVDSRQPLANEPFLVTAELDDKGAEGRIFLAAPVSLNDLEMYFAEQMREERLVFWDQGMQAVRSLAVRRLGALTLKETPLRPTDEEAAAAMVQGIAVEGLSILPWTKGAQALRQRMQFMCRHDPEFPDVSEEVLQESLGDWLGPHLYGMKNRSDLQSLNLAGILEGLLSWEQRRRLDEYAPTHWTVPSGSRIAVDYRDPSQPVLAVRLQEMFGLNESPKIGGGRVPLTLYLLSPANRPVQVTQDLAGFWKHTYFEVRKDLRGRYPKHYWPEDPRDAVPISRTRPKP